MHADNVARFRLQSVLVLFCLIHQLVRVHLTLFLSLFLLSLLVAVVFFFDEEVDVGNVAVDFAEEEIEQEHLLFKAKASLLQ